MCQNSTKNLSFTKKLAYFQLQSVIYTTGVPCAGRVFETPDSDVGGPPYDVSITVTGFESHSHSE